MIPRAADRPQKEAAAEIAAALVRHRKKELFHWTPLSNLPSILQNGLLSRRLLNEAGVPYTPHGYGSATKAEDFSGFVCASLYPQLGMMRTMTEPQAILLLNTQLVCVKGTFFCPQNTARSEYEFETCRMWTSLQDLEDLFEAPNSDWLKDWQAEIWIPRGVAVADIVRVKFATEEITAKALELCSTIQLDHELIFETDASRFP